MNNPLTKTNSLSEFSYFIQDKDGLFRHLEALFNRNEAHVESLVVFPFSEHSYNFDPFKLYFNAPIEGSISSPIYFNKQQIAIIKSSPKLSPSRLAKLTEHVAKLLKRFLIAIHPTSQWQQTQPLLGLNESQFRIDQAIEDVSRSERNVLIYGEPGLEQRDVAFAIHLWSANHQHHLVSIDCALTDTLAQQFMQIHQSTFLLINNVDGLTEPQQLLLLNAIKSRMDYYPNIRIISTIQNDENKIENAELHSILSEETIKLTPLRSRIDDIDWFIEATIRNHPDSNRFSFAPASLKILKSYDWPNNITELRQCIFEVFSNRKEHQISPNTLISTCNGLLSKTAYQSPFSDIAIQLSRKSEISYKNYHPSLIKALNYIGCKYKSHITLADLASSAFISPSHLSFLFKSQLNTTFKQLLCELRILAATRLINEQPYLRITEVSLESGFGDLSHFEKVFRRFHNMTPREYQKAQR